MPAELSIPPRVRIGTAGWSIPKTAAEDFPTEGSHLERYARALDAVEINTSFCRPHRVSTTERWAGAVPDTFRFAVKVPKAITHEARLKATRPLMDRLLEEVAGLGPTLGPLHIQTPPGLPFEIGTADLFLQDLRGRVSAPIACEPRHPSWFAPDVDALLSELCIGRVAADLLLGADRVNVVEGLLTDLARGRVPNIPAEMGVPSAWQHDRQALLSKTPAAMALSALVNAAMQQRRKRRNQQGPEQNLWSPPRRT